MRNTDELFAQMFPQQARQILASSVYVASKMSKSLRDEMISIPRRASMLAGHAFPVFIDRLMAKQIDEIDVGQFPYQYREITIPKCGHAYIEYHSPIGKFHIKKSNKANALPKAAVHRVSNAMSNKIFLDLGSEYIPENTSVPFSLITYGHKNFNITFIQIGFPTWDYSGWESNYCWDISGDISKELVEYIEKKQQVN